VLGLVLLVRSLTDAYLCIGIHGIMDHKGHRDVDISHYLSVSRTNKKAKLTLLSMSLQYLEQVPHFMYVLTDVFLQCDQYSANLTFMFMFRALTLCIVHLFYAPFFQLEVHTCKCSYSLNQVCAGKYLYCVGILHRYSLTSLSSDGVCFSPCSQQYVRASKRVHELVPHRLLHLSGLGACVDQCVGNRGGVSYIEE